MASKIKIAELLVEIGLDSRDAEKAAKNIVRGLDKVKGAGERAGKGTDKAEASLKRMEKTSKALGGVVRGLAAGMTAVGGVLAGVGRSVISTGASFEKLRAQLKTATGSAQGAEKALGFIRDFAKNTPFQVTEITEAFVKLTNLGITPSERALTSYGDTASAMGKSLDQLIEAVADATTGEFERLKEFGIKTRQEGDRVQFTFRGVTTEVGRNSAEIEEFLIGLGENNFAGAMAEQMGTLGGIVSNLKDAFTDFLLSVAEQGPLEEFKALVADLRDASGDKNGLAATLARTLVRAIKALRRALKGDLIETLKSAAETLDFVVRNFDNLVALLSAAKTFQAFTAVAAGFKNMGIAATGVLGPIGAIASALIALIPIAVDVGNKIGDVLGKDATPRTKRQTAKTFGEEFGSFAGSAAAAQKDIEHELRILQGHSDPDSFGAKESRRRLDKAKARKDSLRQKAAQERAKQEAAAAEQRAIQEARQKEDAAESAEFGQFDQDVSAVTEALGIGEGGATGRQQARLDRAIEALAGGKSLADARKAAGLDRSRGGGRRRSKSKEKEKPKVTSPTTVSQFFGAAARGELGPIAARTPSTKDIEPTVAVDITNNNFSFDVKQTISGTGAPGEIASKVAQAIRTEFETRLQTAGQQLASNVAR